MGVSLQQCSGLISLTLTVRRSLLVSFMLRNILKQFCSMYLRWYSQPSPWTFICSDNFIGIFPCWVPTWPLLSLVLFSFFRVVSKVLDPYRHCSISPWLRLPAADWCSVAAKEWWSAVLTARSPDPGQMCPWQHSSPMETQHCASPDQRWQPRPTPDNLRPAAQGFPEGRPAPTL